MPIILSHDWSRWWIDVLRQGAIILPINNQYNVYNIVYIYIFCLKNFDTFTRTPVRVSKMNVFAHAQLTFEMLTLLQIYIYIYMASLGGDELKSQSFGLV